MLLVNTHLRFRWAESGQGGPCWSGSAWAILAGLRSFLPASPAGPDVASGAAARSLLPPLQPISCHRLFVDSAKNCTPSNPTLGLQPASCWFQPQHVTPHVVTRFSSSLVLRLASRTQTLWASLPLLRWLPWAASCSPHSPEPWGVRRHRTLSSSTRSLSGRLTRARGFRFHLLAVLRPQKDPQPSRPQPSDSESNLLPSYSNRHPHPRAPERSMHSGLSELSSVRPLLSRSCCAPALKAPAPRPLSHPFHRWTQPESTFCWFSLPFRPPCRPHPQVPAPRAGGVSQGAP